MFWITLRPRANLRLNVLDYAGRVTNGSWTGYSVGARSTKSGIVESSASLSEFKDPILYATQPQVSSFINSRKEAAIDYDFRNLFTRFCLQPRVEMFLGKIFPKNASSFFSF